MALNESKGNMYKFITHTWNAVKGACPHDCSYCYMKRWGRLNPPRFDEKELKTDLGTDNFVFVGSSCDMFADNIHDKWITDTLLKCQDYSNSYLFQSKNVEGIWKMKNYLPKNSVICTTFETNRWYNYIMRESPKVEIRSAFMRKFMDYDRFVTIEPIIDFDLIKLLELIKAIEPVKINIGADSGRKDLPEPDKEKVLQLINNLSEFTIVNKKKNLARILV